jgi:hypothetical protein
MLAIDLGKLFGRERESLGIFFLGQGTLFVNKEKESVFLRIKKGKHFPALTFHFFC